VQRSSGRAAGSGPGGADAADPLNYIVVTLIFLGAAAMASWLPARRATRIDPMRSLRVE
jgi:ABC-type lipoprotein release transport system permease subunit